MSFAIGAYKIHRVVIPLNHNAALEKYVCMRRASYFSTILCLCTHKIMEFLFWEEAYDFHKFPDDALEPIRLFSLNFQSMLMKACCKIPRYCQFGQNRVYTHAFLSGINNMVPWGLWSIWSAEICFLSFLPNNRQNLGSPPPT